MGVIDGEDPKPLSELSLPTKIVAWSLGVSFSMVILAGAARLCMAILDLQP